jgi:uncharacterized protein Veg
MEKAQIDKVRKTVLDGLNQNVMVTIPKGRNKKITVPGVLENAYPNVFTIKLDENALTEFPGAQRRLSFSYIDVMTKSVGLSFGEEEAAKQEAPKGEE